MFALVPVGFRIFIQSIPGLTLRNVETTTSICQNGTMILIFMPQSGIPNSWLVYFMEHPINEWMTGGFLHWKPPYDHVIYIYVYSSNAIQ